jgi:hypothetical protein
MHRSVAEFETRGGEPAPTFGTGKANFGSVRRQAQSLRAEAEHHANRSDGIRLLPWPVQLWLLPPYHGTAVRFASDTCRFARLLILQLV